ncbi:MAG: extracellular solute-binding protein [Chloroflexota bacterium]|nr:extracellular solute-binding protein [Chloroflexota bacterium]
MVNIDRSSPIPIYHQLKTMIQGQIENGLWRPGDRLPTEQELCQTYNISRSPVRQALKELEYEGAIFRQPGLGTFVEGGVATVPSSDTPIKTMSSDPHWSKVLDQASDAWNVKHSNLRVTFQVDVVSHNEFYNLLSAAVGSGTAPDVAIVDGVWVAGLAQSGFLYALQDQASSSEQNHPEFVRDLHPASVKANSYDGKLYGLPVKSDASLLWYRKDWFTQEGLEPPQDWDDLLTIANHFLQPQAQERYGYAYPLAFPGGTSGGEATVYNLMPFIWSAGGEIFNTEAETVVLDAPGARRALQFLQELVTLHRVSPPEVVDYDEYTSPRLFARGKAAMSFGGSYESNFILDTSGWGDDGFMQRVGYVASPAAPGGRQVSTVGGTSYVILRQCPSPALVMNVLKTVTDPDVVGDLYRSMLQNLPSPSFSTLLSPETDSLLMQTSRLISSGRARPSIPEYVKVSRQLQTMFETAIVSPEPIDEIVQRAAEFIGAISERPCRPA